MPGLPVNELNLWQPSYEMALVAPLRFTMVSGCLNHHATHHALIASREEGTGVRSLFRLLLTVE